ncbi:MAG: ASKHA domain-containing protein [Thermodesulfobacteriota bacterium]|nr:ASKHA domain-containing protein [Thermodesulfobacteriota bacterium]
MKKFKVTFQPSGKRGEIHKGKTILEASRELGVQIESLCGGEKTCGKCKVKMLEGELSSFTDEEAKFISESERLEGYRLSCSARIRGNVLIFVPEESLIQKQVVRKEIAGKRIEHKPALISYYIELTPPSFHDLRSDCNRLKKALSQNYHFPHLDIDYPALLKLPHVLREGNWKVTAVVWMDREILDIRPGHVKEIYGIAIDVGTTTVAAYLCNLGNGEVVATESRMNPQVIYGEDVMSRITYTMTHPDGLQTLHQAITNGLNQLIQTITERIKLSPDDILELTVVGNTVMHHLLLGIDPQYLGVSPFPPALNRSMDIKARDLGLKVHPSANVHILPVEAGFVGADNVGVLIAEEPYNQDAMVLIVDVGTNGELVMGNRNQLLSASCATGPAFEGAHIRFGMRAALGAIERVRIDADTLGVDFKVIGDSDWKSKSGNVKAKGICGSGIIDAVAELYRNGVIDKSGRFKKELPSSRLIVSDEKPEFVIAWKDETSIGKEITITQQDVRSVQLAKGALHAGAKLMMKKLGIEKLDRVILAGAFGTYIDPENAMILGMFPDCDLKNVYAVGNAAGDGARMALLSRDKRADAEKIARKVEYVELTIEQDFQKEFIGAMQIPHMRDLFPHLMGVVRDEILDQ